MSAAIRAGTSNDGYLQINGIDAVKFDVASGMGVLIAVTRFTSTGPFTPNPLTKSVIVDAVGGGGAGGGAAITNSSQISAGTGGGSGGHTIGRFLNPGAQTVTVGAGGVGVAGGTGGNGGASSFGSLLVANGGSGGSAVAAGSLIVGGGGAGGTASATGGNILACTGNTAPILVNTSGTGFPYGQLGANSIYGGGGGHIGFSGTGLGPVAGGFGAGGGGASNSFSEPAARPGGPGHGGIVTLYEYA